VVRQEQLDHGAAGFDNTRGGCADVHAFCDVGGTGWSQVAAAIDFDHADAAGSGLIDGLKVVKVQMAEGGDLDVDLSGCFENRHGIRYIQLDVINFDFYFAHMLNFRPPYFLSTASNAQALRQAPHLMHLLCSMTCGFLTEPEMHLVGQARAQAVQPMHLSSMMV